MRTRTRLHLWSLAVTTALLAGAWPARAGVLTIPGGNVSASTVGGARTPDKLVVTGPGHFFLNPSGTEYRVPADGDRNWLSASGQIPPVPVTFDLGGKYELGMLKVWNYFDVQAQYVAGAFTVGVQTMDIYYSDDNGSNYYPLLTGVNLRMAPEPNSLPSDGFGPIYDDPDIILLGNVSGVTHLQLRLTSNYGGLGAGYYGLSQVQLFVPEPTAAAALVSLGLFLIARRRGSDA